MMIVWLFERIFGIVITAVTPEEAADEILGHGAVDDGPVSL